MITILHGGSLGTTKSDYVICARPLMTTRTIAPTVQITLKFLLIKILNTLKTEIDNDKDRDRE